MAGTRETEVRLDVWCEGGLVQQRNDGGGCTSMRERSESVESPGTYVTECVLRGRFCLALFFRTTHPCSGGYHMEMGGMPLHDALGINYKNAATTEYQGADVAYMG